MRFVEVDIGQCAQLRARRADHLLCRGSQLLNERQKSQPEDGFHAGGAYVGVEPPAPTIDRSTYDDIRDERVSQLRSRHIPRSNLSASMLAELQSVQCPLAVVVSAFGAGFVSSLWDAGPSISFQFGAGLLAGIVFYVVTMLSTIHAPVGIRIGDLRLRAIVIATSLTFLGVTGIFRLLGASDLVPWSWLGLWYVLSLSTIALCRRGNLFWARMLMSQQRLQERVAIYGSAALAAPVAAALQGAGGDFRVIGFYTDDVQTGATADGLGVSGGIQDLVVGAQRGNCDRVIVALPRDPEARIADALERLDLLPIDIQLCPDAMAIPTALQQSAPGGLVLLDVRSRPLSAHDQLVKALMDYTVATVALVAVAPVMVLIALAIKLDSRGPVFFVQLRHGYNHRLVRVIKFRTMTVWEDGPVVKQAERGDRRVTRVGRFLRKSSLDELPQLINVLRGELSLVGPRPHAVSHNYSYAQVIRHYANRHKVKPGITGWAQVNGFRGETPTTEAMSQRLERDLYYIEHWSPSLDAEILLRTLLVPFQRTNAF